jgi:hypothetical protein
MESKIESLVQILRGLNDEALIDELLVHVVKNKRFTSVSLDDIGSVEEEIEGIALKHEEPDRIKVLHKSTDVQASESNKLVKLDNGWDNGLIVFGPRTKEVGLSSMSFSFDGQVEGGATVGIVLAGKNTPKSGFVNKTDSGWAYFQNNGCIGHGGPATKPYGVDFAESGDLVDVELNATKGTLKFYTNGEPQGIAFDDLPQNAEFYFAVSLMEKNSSVEVYDNYIIDPCIELLLMTLNRRRAREATRKRLGENLKNLNIRCERTTKMTKLNVIDFMCRQEDDKVMLNILSFIMFRRVNVGVWLSSSSFVPRAIPISETFTATAEEFVCVGKDIFIREDSLWD